MDDFFIAEILRLVAPIIMIGFGLIGISLILNIFKEKDEEIENEIYAMDNEVAEEEVAASETVTEAEEEPLTVDDVLLEDGVELISETAQEDTTGLLVHTLNFAFLMAGGIFAIIAIIKVVQLGIHLFTSEKRAEKAEEEKDLEDVSPFDNPKTEFEQWGENITALRDKAVATASLIKDREIKQKVRDIEAIINKIIDNTDESEYNTGNLDKLNTFFLPSFLKMLDNFVSLEGITGIDNAKSRNARNTLKKNIMDADSIFSKILMEALDKDVTEAEVNADVFKQYATLNGLTDDALNFGSENDVFLKV